ncbi:MAG: hypothetical protein MZU95_16550 [Desulfomicrobium escambiense]|nr:hypothetical protein [Desulfomicrobium escambiense]
MAEPDPHLGGVILIDVRKPGLSLPRRVILLSIAASIITMLLKFGAYFLTHSVSLLSDAAESSVNLISALVAFARPYHRGASG